MDKIIWENAFQQKKKKYARCIVKLDKHKSRL